MLIAAFLALALQTPAPEEPPRGVNDEVLGTAEEFRTAGPARVCLISTSIDLLAGETAYLDYLGIHHGSIRVVGRRGTFIVREGEAWRVPRGGTEVTDRRHRPMSVYERGGRLRYLLYAPPQGSRHRRSARTWIEGDALGTRRDEAILDRIQLPRDGPTGCQHQFHYGWYFDE